MRNHNYGQYFLPLWCALQNENDQNEQTEYADEEQDCKQTPTYYDSNDGNHPVEGLKFFPNNKCLEYRFKCISLERGGHHQYIKRFSKDQGVVLRLELRHHRSGSPQAFFLVQFNAITLELHVHFKRFPARVVTQINSVDVSDGSRYMYIHSNVLDGIAERCRIHVTDRHWYDERSWNKQPPHSRSAVFEMCDPTNLILHPTVCSH